MTEDERNQDSIFNKCTPKFTYGTHQCILSIIQSIIFLGGGLRRMRGKDYRSVMLEHFWVKGYCHGKELSTSTHNSLHLIKPHCCLIVHVLLRSDIGLRKSLKIYRLNILTLCCEDYLGK
ncbi:hypothetical protein BDF20DRAFT_987751 [Mycotypha africana]|uniref:uncharacterized protein n=1 Tax=Mycotypha africana TaxID=64632 RepID=UPI002301506C|nr:uncharacterized protein BDF20DRAFT_987751 [Mycotypha africana]KAI8979500.1 hypothetical protein BDF20DRAFT_987751 [Mycotypha africana]